MKRILASLLLLFSLNGYADHVDPIKLNHSSECWAYAKWFVMDYKAFREGWKEDDWLDLNKKELDQLHSAGVDLYTNYWETVVDITKEVFTLSVSGELNDKTIEKIAYDRYHKCFENKWPIKKQRT